MTATYMSAANNWQVIPITRYGEMQEVVRHGSCPTKPNLTTPEFVGELPCRTNSVSDKVRLPDMGQSLNKACFFTFTFSYAVEDIFFLKISLFFL